MKRNYIKPYNTYKIRRNKHSLQETLSQISEYQQELYKNKNLESSRMLFDTDFFLMLRYSAKDSQKKYLKSESIHFNVDNTMYVYEYKKEKYQFKINGNINDDFYISDYYIKDQNKLFSGQKIFTKTNDNTLSNKELYIEFPETFSNVNTIIIEHYFPLKFFVKTIKYIDDSNTTHDITTFEEINVFGTVQINFADVQQKKIIITFNDSVELVNDNTKLLAQFKNVKQMNLVKNTNFKPFNEGTNKLLIQDKCHNYYKDFYIENNELKNSSLQSYQFIPYFLFEVIE